MANLLREYQKNKISNLLKGTDREWLDSTIAKYPDGELSVEQMWKLLDDIWKEFKCDQFWDDDMVGKFYSHPVWLLNGLHIEGDPISLSHRVSMCNWVRSKRFKRIADFGGGFGGLARLIGENCNDCEVEIIDPFPNEVGVHLAKKLKNVNYFNKLNGTYDLIIATDVFEHINDPLQVLYDTSKHLHRDGSYLIGNCFEPVILCHLPSTFHFGSSWDIVLKHLGLIPKEKVAYARAYKITENLNMSKARRAESRSKNLYTIIKFLPRRIQALIVSVIL